MSKYIRYRWALFPKSVQSESEVLTWRKSENRIRLLWNLGKTREMVRFLHLCSCKVKNVKMKSQKKKQKGERRRKYLTKTKHLTFFFCWGNLSWMLTIHQVSFKKYSKIEGSIVVGIINLISQIVFYTNIQGLWCCFEIQYDLWINAYYIKIRRTSKKVVMRTVSQQKKNIKFF